MVSWLAQSLEKSRFQLNTGASVAGVERERAVESIVRHLPRAFFGGGALPAQHWHKTALLLARRVSLGRASSVSSNPIKHYLLL